MQKLKISDELRTGAGKSGLYGERRFGVPTVESAISAIVSLLLRRSPANVHRPSVRVALLAVSARVVAVIVDSINGVFRRRARTNVFAEDVWRVDPALADDHSTLAPLFIIRARGVIASVLEPFPRVILNCLAQSVCSIGSTRLSAKTPARNCRAAQMILSDRGLPSAVAGTHPSSMLGVRAGSLLQNDKHPKGLPYQVWPLLHGGHYSAESVTYGE